MPHTSYKQATVNQTDKINKHVYDQIKESKNEIMKHYTMHEKYKHIKQSNNKDMDERNKYKKYQMNKTSGIMHTKNQ